MSGFPPPWFGWFLMGAGVFMIFVSVACFALGWSIVFGVKP